VRTRGNASGGSADGSIAGLLWPSHGEQIDASVASLRSALEESPRDARILSDLSAAYMVRANFRDEPYDLMLALARAEEAVAADPGLLEARFNRALALEKLFLTEPARRAWQEYGRLDRGSGWAAEAEERARALKPLRTAESWDADKALLRRAADAGRLELVKGVVQRNRQAARELAEQELLSDWAEAYLSSNYLGAESALRSAGAIGAALASINGDRLVADSIAAIEKASRDPRRARSLAEGHRAFRDGFMRYKAYDSERAAERLAVAEKTLRSAETPFAERAAFWHACVEYHLDHYEEAYDLLEALEERLQNKPYPSLMAHVLWMKGLLNLILGDPMSSLVLYRSAFGLFQRLREADNVASIGTLIAESLDNLGRYREAWRHRFLALQAGDAVRDPQLISVVYGGAAQSALQQGDYPLALRFQNELIRRLEPSKNSELLTEAYFWRAQMEEKNGNPQEALGSVTRARQHAAEIPDDSIRRDASAGTDLIEGSILSSTQPQRAVDLLSSALAVYTEARHHLLTMMGYRERGRAYRHLGEQTLAEDDLLAGLAAYEKLGGNISDLEIKMAFLHQAQELFDELIGFEAIERQSPEAAFGLAERIHTKSLLESAMTVKMAAEERGRMLGAEKEALSASAIRSRVPEDRVLVQYAVLGDRVLIWLVSPRQPLQAFERRITRRKLRTLVQLVRTGTDDEDSREWRLAASSLYELLVAPWIGNLKSGEELVFVPDKELSSLPFACLIDPKSNRYLIDNYTFAVAPSATVFVRMAERVRVPSLGRKILPPLVIGNPAFDRTSFPGLPLLTAAEGEAKGVAASAPSSRLLIGPQATKEAFLALAPQSEWIHFAGHALVDERSPLKSMLLFASSSTSEIGSLYAHEIYQLDLSRVRLIVVSACDSARGDPPEGEGFTNFARAFMAVGVPTVIGSLWSINDRSTSALFKVFYEELSAGKGPAQALRSAQLQLLGSADASLRSPSSWGAFEAFGAD
jgi:CHAT domain-containing protein